jgi:hypothetical protein
LITETVTIGEYTFEIKRYTLKDTLEIQAILSKATKEDGTIDATKVDYQAFFIESIMRGLVKAKIAGQEIPVTKEFILSLDTEIANILLSKITELNRKSFFQIKK